MTINDDLDANEDGDDQEPRRLAEEMHARWLAPFSAPWSGYFSRCSGHGREMSSRARTWRWVGVSRSRTRPAAV